MPQMEGKPIWHSMYASRTITRVLKFLAIANWVALASGCSLLFAPDDNPFPEGQGPDLRFEFNGHGESNLRSTGTFPVELELFFGAELTADALDVSLVTSNEYALASHAAASTADLIALNQKCTNAQAVSFSAWITVTGTEELNNSPARIFSIESSRSRRNFTFGQTESSTGTFDASSVRIGDSSFAGPRMTIGEPLFVFTTIDEQGQWRLQIGDVEISDTLSDPKGLFTWDESAALTIGAASSSERGWQGHVHQLMFFCRSLDPSEQEILSTKTCP